MTTDGSSPTLAEFLRKQQRQVAGTLAIRLCPRGPQHLPRAISGLEERFYAAENRPPETATLDKVREELLLAWNSRHHLEALPPRTLRLAPWAIWENFPPAADPAFPAIFVRTGETNARGRFVFTLAHTFVFFYPIRLPTFQEWRWRVESAFDRWAHDRQRWRERWQRWKQYKVLANNGDRSFSQILTKTGNIEAVLEHSGLQRDLGRSAFVKAALNYLLDHLSVVLRSAEIDERNLATLENFVHEGELRFPDLKRPLADALLLPFSKKNPSEVVRQRLVMFLKTFLGDPRLAPTRWYGISKEAQEVMRRWLAGATLADFFALIDDTAERSQWRARRAFWWEYWEKGHITDAWIALASTPYRRLREESRSGAACLEGAAHNQAALLLCVGRALVLEWSHAGACRIFASENLEKPKMFAERYTTTQLRGGKPDWRVCHVGSRWQEEVRRALVEIGGLPSPPVTPPSYIRRARW